jgi:hypothetical protein
LATPLNSGTNLNIEYTRADGNVIECENTSAVTALATLTGGTGKYQAITDESSLGLIQTSAASGLLLAQEALAAYGTVPQLNNVEILIPGILPGQNVTLALAGAAGTAMNGSYFVEEVRAQLIPVKPWGHQQIIPGAGHYRYSLKLISIAEIGSYMDFWQGLNGGGAGGSGTALVATSGGAQAATSGGIAIEIGGAALSSSTTLNLIAGSNISITDGGSGRVGAVPSGAARPKKASSPCAPARSPALPACCRCHSPPPAWRSPGCSARCA